jgi:hypothetical protein
MAGLPKRCRCGILDALSDESHESMLRVNWAGAHAPSDFRDCSRLGDRAVVCRSLDRCLREGRSSMPIARQSWHRVPMTGAGACVAQRWRVLAVSAEWSDTVSTGPGDQYQTQQFRIALPSTHADRLSPRTFRAITGFHVTVGYSTGHTNPVRWRPGLCGRSRNNAPPRTQSSSPAR